MQKDWDAIRQDLEDYRSRNYEEFQRAWYSWEESRQALREPKMIGRNKITVSELQNRVGETDVRYAIMALGRTEFLQLNGSAEVLEEREVDALSYTTRELNEIDDIMEEVATEA